MNSIDRQLLFVSVARQNRLLDKQQIIQLLNEWSRNQLKPIAEIATELDLLNPGDCAVVERLVQRLTDMNFDLEESLDQHTASFDPLATGQQITDQSIKNRLLELSANARFGVKDLTHSITLANLDSNSNQDQEGFFIQQSSNSNVDGTNVDGTLDRSFSGSTNSSTIPLPALARGDIPGARFAVVRQHAKGGLGKVSVAEDLELNRQVALKEIRSRFSNDRLCRERFNLEARITGGLEHPGVVPVYGFGKGPKGHPYFAMRFIRGQSFKEAISDYHTVRDSLTESQQRLRFRDLLARFVDVCNTIGYAHSRGVLHRDIKPTNIMLGKFGETLVVDWGLAKSVGRDERHRTPEEETLLPFSGDASSTMDGSTVGTPAFMSPEQAAGRLGEMGPASDNFSLGATLYVLLTGQVAFQGETARATVEMAKRNEFVAPREVDSQIPKALNAICIKAMSTAPVDRYPTALLLAKDIEHWLADEPVSALNEPWSHQTARWLRRHKTFAVALLVLLLSLVVASLIGLVLLNNEKKQTELALGKAVAAEQKTEQALQQTEAALEKETEAHKFASAATQRTRSVLNLVTNDLVGEMMASQSFGEADQVFLDLLVKQLEQFSSSTGDSEPNLEMRAESLSRIANLQRRLGRSEKAEQAYIDATEAWRELRQSAPEDTNIQRELANTLGNHAILLASGDQHEQAIAKETEAAKLLSEVRKNESTDETLKREISDDLAKILTNRGNAWSRMNKPAFAMQDYDRAAELLREIPAEDRDEQSIRTLAVSLMNRAGLHAKDVRGRAEAESAYRQAVAYLSDAATDSVGSIRDLATARQNLGNFLLGSGQPDLAFEQFRNSIDAQKSLVEKYPKMVNDKFELARSCLGLADTLAKQRRPGVREELLAALDIVQTLVVDFDNRPQFGNLKASILERLGINYRDEDPDVADDYYLRALKIRDELAKKYADVADFQVQHMASQVTYANFRRLKKDYEKATEFYQNVLRFMDDKNIVHAQIKHSALFGVGDCYMEQKNYPQALEVWVQLTENADAPNRDIFELQRAICLIRTGQIDAGLEVAEKVAASAKQNPGLIALDAACCYAIAIEEHEATTTDEGDDSESRDRRLTKYRELAMKHLTKAESEKIFELKIYRDVLLNDEDLNSIRELPVFKRLIGSVKLHR